MQAAARPGTQVVLAMIGAVCATLITRALDTSPTVSLIGAALGAAIPALVGYVGPYAHLRVSVAVVVTAVALFVTYGGFTWFAFATDRPETFPIPSPLPKPDADGGEGGAIHTTVGRLGIDVTPKTLHCQTDECEEPVIITSTGEELLETYGIEFEGEAAAEFGRDDTCENKRLRKDEECRFTVSFTPSGPGGTRKATLVIHQNLPKFPTKVPVEGEVEDGGPPPPSPPPPPALGDLIPVLDSVECLHQEGGARVNGQLKNALQISFVLRLEGADPRDLPGLVLIRARSSRGPSASPRVGVGGRLVVALPLGSSDYGRIHSVTVRVDPDHEVSESDEGNNHFRVRVHVPAQPASTQSLRC